MNDWLPDLSYRDFLKKRKRKHSKALFNKHIANCFADKGIDIDYIRNAPKIFMELFWQCETLKEWNFSLSGLIAHLIVGERIREKKQIDLIKLSEQYQKKQKQIIMKGK